jgi:hypothetical protein
MKGDAMLVAVALSDVPLCTCTANGELRLHDEVMKRDVNINRA